MQQLRNVKYKLDNSPLVHKSYPIKKQITKKNIPKKQ
ncbi:hypothetical protein FLBR109950_08460 [Flavobacterium branchiophilum]